MMENQAYEPVFYDGTIDSEDAQRAANDVSRGRYGHGGTDGNQ